MEGVWIPLGAPALVDWCESNYAVTPWVAEFWNTASSWLIVAMGVFGFWRCRDAELRFRLGMVGACAVGFGSSAFHGMLLRWAQAADELPMVWLGLACAWTMADRARAPGEGTGLAWGLFGFGIAFCVAYWTVPAAFLLFVGVYGVIVAWLAIRTLHLSFFRSTSPRCRRMAVLVVAAYLGAFFAFWLPEHVLLPCDHPLQILQLHSWWHVGAGVGTVAWWEWARADREGLAELRSDDVGAA